MIFFLIAGTYTPFALLVLNGPLADAILVVVWAGAVAGAAVEVVWIDHPKWVAALIYISLGWVAAVAFPQLWVAMGVAGTLLVAAGGLLYTAGAVVYATQRPDSEPPRFRLSRDLPRPGDRRSSSPLRGSSVLRAAGTPDR